jgi:sugar phosphate isomerase/epimerase
MNPNHGAGMVSRRSFLGMLVGGVASGGVSGRAQGLVNYLVGCYTRPWDQFELETALDGVAEAGYRHVGLMTAKGRSWVIITPQTTTREAVRVGELARERGLKVCSVYGAFSARESLAEGERQLRRLVDHCAACRSPELLLGGTADGGELEGYVQAIARCCEYADRQGVGLTIKPHGGLNATGAQCRGMIERVGHRNFRLWYDPGNIFYYSGGALDPLEDVIDVDGLVVGLSVKDFRPPKEVLITPGTGTVNFPVLLARLRLGGFLRGQLVVECTAPGDYRQVTEEARKARVFVERLARGRGLDGLKPAPREGVVTP